MYSLPYGKDFNLDERPMRMKCVPDKKVFSKNQIFID